MTKIVREPIQVYLTPRERAELDRVAGEMGVSRSEALRRGVETLGARSYDGALRDLVDEGMVTPPLASSTAAPPPSKPVAPLAQLLEKLVEDRSDR